MRPLPWLIAIVITAGVCWRFPLFHVVSLQQAQREKAAATFDPKKFAETIWRDQVPLALPNAIPANALLLTLKTNASLAKSKFSRSVGVSESYTYFLSGQGRVVAMSDDEISLAITAGTTNAEIALQVGLLFNNAVRDGTGLLSINDYPNSQDFNALSEALNQIIETRVQPKLRAAAKIGSVIAFVGCAEVNDEATDLRPLKVVPVQTEVP